MAVIKPRPLTRKARTRDASLHAALVDAARRWLLGQRRCSFVLTELMYASSLALEIPDALGFRCSEGLSLLVECKTSRADFLADASKPHRIDPELGMGDFRFYLTPEGLLAPEELPAGWGLLETTFKGRRPITRQIIGPCPTLTSSVNAHLRHPANKRAEWGLMASALRLANQARKVQP